MWQLLNRKAQLFIIVALTSLVLLVAQGLLPLVRGAEVQPMQLVSIAVFFVGTVLIAAFNWSWRWLWARIPWLSTSLFPDLNGTWKGTLQTTWVNEHGVVPGPIPATIWIRQSLLTIHVQQQTGESDSWSVRVFPEATADAGRFALWYSYDNQPRAAVRARSARHDGIARLELAVPVGADRLTGQYFTSRRTTGDIEVVRIDREFIGA